MAENKKVEEMSYFELLAWLGIGSSHPGGFAATKQNLAAMPVKRDEQVLEAGCGSGLTACYLAQTTGARITGIDLNPLMIEKARLRAQKEGVVPRTQFRCADIYALPFPDNVFDWVIAESVTIFLDKSKAFRELYRVLKPGGRIADLEMILRQELPLPLAEQLQVYYGRGTDPLSPAKWRQALAGAGFDEVGIHNFQPRLTADSPASIQKDWLLFADLQTKIQRNPGLIPRLEKIAAFMQAHQGYFGFGLLYGRKPLAAGAKPELEERPRNLFRRKGFGLKRSN